MMINQLFAKLSDSPNFKNISLLIKLFRLATKGEQDEEQNENVSNYFKEPEDYSKVIQFSLIQLPNILREFYHVDYADSFSKDHMQQHMQQVLIRGFFIKALNFLEHTIETQETEEGTILFVIRSLGALNSVLSAFESLIKKSMKLLIQIWGDCVSLQLKLHAFVQIRKIYASMADYQQHDIIKKFYLKYMESAKHVVWRTYEGINFMINCVTELCNMNMNQGYQVAYESLQSLVKKLREASVAKTQQNVQSIYNQQTLNILKLWAQVICTHKLENQMADLMPPLIQIIQAVLDFYPCVDNYTFQLQLLDILMKISKIYNVNQNLLHYMLRMLNCAELKRRKLKSSIKPYDFEINITIKPKYKQSGTFWADFCQQIVNKIIIYLATFSKQPWLFEYTLFLEKSLKRVSQDFGFVGNKIKVKDLIRIIEQNQQHKGKKGESNLESEAQRILYEQEELIKQKVLAEKERQEKGEELEESEQEIDDEKDQEFVMDEIRKYKDEKKKQVVAEDDIEGLSEYEGDPENYQEEAGEDDNENDSDS